jgi:hypothetical protein
MDQNARLFLLFVGYRLTKLSGTLLLDVSRLETIDGKYRCRFIETFDIVSRRRRRRHLT